MNSLRGRSSAARDREKFESCYPKFGFDRSIHKLKIEKTRKKNRILTQMLQLKRKLNRSK